MKIAIIVGSLRAESYNRKLAENVARRLEADGHGVDFMSVDLPLMSEDLESEPPQVVVDTAAMVKVADLVMIISPEYNRSLPGGLKNLLDWLSRPCAGLALKNKLVAIGGVSTGGVATAVMQSHLRSILLQLGALVMGQPTLMMTVGGGISENGELSADGQKFVDEFVQSALDFAGKISV